TIEASDASVSAWGQVARMLSAPRAFHAAAVGADNLIYIVGGMPYPTVGALDTFESIDPAVDASGAATAQAVLPLARSQLAASDDSLGRIVAIGGARVDGTASDQVDVYDTTAKAWSSGAPLMVPRAQLGTARGADGRIYAVGGQNDFGGALADVEALTTNASHWTPIVSISPARAASAVARGWDGRVYAIGGRTAGTPVVNVEAYGPRVKPGPQLGAPGTVVALSCSNFAANANVTVTFSGDTAGVVAASGTTNAQGSASPSLTWHVPQVASGTYTLTAVDDRARYPVRATFVVP
ncbi:MAG: kelch repeat-containing protein, partial [Polyangia bacterium]